MSPNDELTSTSRFYNAPLSAIVILADTNGSAGKVYPSGECLFRRDYRGMRLVIEFNFCDISGHSIF
jgi:hypothetical protein